MSEGGLGDPSRSGWLAGLRGWVGRAELSWIGGLMAALAHTLTCTHCALCPHHHVCAPSPPRRLQVHGGPFQLHAGALPGTHPLAPEGLLLEVWQIAEDYEAAQTR